MTTGTVQHLTEQDFDEQVLQSDRPVLVDFWADWCQPCHILSPTIEALAEQFGDSVRITKVESDAAQELTNRYGVRSIPTVIIFKDGQEIERLVGVRQQVEYEQALDRALG